MSSAVAFNLLNVGNQRMSKTPQRLQPTPSTIKKLFAYSGNQCAIPDCTETIVDISGTMLGKIAHICAAEKGGTRYDPAMTDEQRRDFSNLFIVCGKHHDIIDDKNNEAAFPAPLLRTFKAKHEGRFRKAERQLIRQFVDTTQTTQPIYPKRLTALAEVVDVNELADNDDEIRRVHKFIDRLKELPLQEREFALKVAERMRRRNESILPVEDVAGAFGISSYVLRQHMKVLDHHHLGCIDENNPGEWVVRLFNRDGGGDPWWEILEFCEKTGRATDELIYDLDFSLYDD